MMAREFGCLTSFWQGNELMSCEKLSATTAMPSVSENIVRLFCAAGAPIATKKSTPSGANASMVVGTWTSAAVQYYDHVETEIKIMRV